MLDQSKYEEVLLRARKRFAQAVDAERDIRLESLIDLDYIAGNQWDPKVKTEREREPSPRPCLVFNKVLPPVTQLGNQARQNKPAIKVSPVDSAGDVETAKALQGMIRHIEYDSDADQAYDTALFYAAACGFGFWRYGCERIPKSFDQEIKTITVEDPFSIYLDCNARKPDRSDMKWAFVIDKMANETYEARFGKDRADLSSDFLSELNEEGWRDEDGKRIAEYWEVDSVKKTLRIRKDDDGTVHNVYLEDLKDGEADELTWVPEDENDPESGPKEAIDEIPRVMQYIINGSEVLEEPTIWDGSTIPIVILTGLEMIVRGQRKLFSMTRFARDPQQLYNYYKTMEAETIALAPKPKWVGAVGQFKTKRRDWARANTDNAAFLEYDAVAVGDKAVGEPQWRTFDPPIQALSIGAAAASDSIKSATGYFDPSLGNIKGDQSGVAIGKLQKQGDVSNFHFFDNQARALKRGGRIMVELIPIKYDTARETRIVGEDQKQSIIMLNAPGIDENGKPYHHKLDQGKYDVRVQQGSSFETQRAETREMIMALAQGNPEVWQLAADIFFENQDFVGADRLAKRFKKALPPAMQDDDNANKDIPPQVQAQMAQDKQAMQLLQGQNQQLMELLKTKVLDLESKERQTTETNQARIQIAETTSKSASMNALASIDHAGLQAELNRRADILHAQIDVMASVAADEQERQHAAQMQQQAHAHAAGMAAQANEHQAGMAGQAQQHQTGMADQQNQAATAAAEQAQAAQPVAPPDAAPKKKTLK